MTTVHQPILPSEITDAIIDHLQSDTAALGTCSFVCSEWLFRSRHHMFRCVQLWPWRVRRFFELANERLCTFADHVRRIEMDDLKVREKEAEVRTARSEGTMFETMRLPHPPCFAGVQAIRICNVDWTCFSMNEQTAVRNNLARLVRLDRLELQGVVFHDLREVGRIVNALTALQHLTANVSFKKYIQHTIPSGVTLGSANTLQSLEIGTEDGIAVVLNYVLNSGGAENIRVLKLDNIKPGHLPCIETLLKKSGRNLQRLMLGLGKEKIPIMTQEGGATMIDLSQLPTLRTLHIRDLTVPQTRGSSIVEESLGHILQRIDSSFLDTIELSFVLRPDSDLRCMDWRQLERVLLTLHFFGMRIVRIFLDIVPCVEQKWVWEMVEKIMCEAMPDLYGRGVLKVHAMEERGNGQAKNQGVCEEVE